MILFLILFSVFSAAAADISVKLDTDDGSSGISVRNLLSSEVFRISSSGDAIVLQGITIGNSSAAADGIMRYSGTDFEGRKSGSWVSLTKDGTGADHGLLTGLSDDDHSQYHNNTRGDARYFQKTEFLVTSAGAGDSGKPVKLDAGGKIDDSTLLDSDIDHGSISGLSDDDHVQYLKVDGSRSLSGNWDIGDTLYIAADKIRARDNAGLYLQDDGGNGIFVKDGGFTGIGTASPGETLEVNGAVIIGNASGTADGTVRWTGTDFEGRKSGSWVSLSQVSSAAQDFIHLEYAVASGTALTNYAAAGWNLQKLNSEVSDTGNHCSLNTGTSEFTIDAGTYRIMACCHGFGTEGEYLALYNVSDITKTLSGGVNSSGDWDWVGLGSFTPLFMDGVFTIASSKTFKIQVFITVWTLAQDTYPCSFGDSEIYTQVLLWKLQ